MIQETDNAATVYENLFIRRHHFVPMIHAGTSRAPITHETNINRTADKGRNVAAGDNTVALRARISYEPSHQNVILTGVDDAPQWVNGGIGSNVAVCNDYRASRIACAASGFCTGTN